MNPRFIERIIAYRDEYTLSLTKEILRKKIHLQGNLLKKTSVYKSYANDFDSMSRIEDCLLLEARVAKKYWKDIGMLLDKKCVWRGRDRMKKDAVNRILNIGYHHIVNKLNKIFTKHDVYTGLGFFHKAQKSDSLPLVYDFMEWLRPFLVDYILLKFLRKKKKVVLEIDKKDIRRFLFMINNRIQKKFYNSDLGYSITLEYWIELQVLHLQYCINNKKLFRLRIPTMRNDSRVKNN